MLRFLFVFSATPFSIYNPDNGKTRVVYQIGLVSHPNSGSPTWKDIEGIINTRGLYSIYRVILGWVKFREN